MCLRVRACGHAGKHQCVGRGHSRLRPTHDQCAGGLRKGIRKDTGTSDEKALSFQVEAGAGLPARGTFPEAQFLGWRPTANPCPRPSHMVWDVTPSTRVCGCVNGAIENSCIGQSRGATRAALPLKLDWIAAVLPKGERPRGRLCQSHGLGRL